MTRQLSRFAALLAGGVLLVALCSWPFVVNLGDVSTSGRADGDLGYTLLAQWWASQSLAGEGSFFDCTLVYFPEGQNLAGSVWNLVVLFATAPLHWFAEPITAYNLSILLIALANVLTFFCLGHRLGGNWGGVIAAAVVASMPYTWFELYEGRPEQGFLAPAALYALALIRFRENQPRATLLLGLAMAGVAACYWFMAPLLALGLLPILGSSLRSRETWKKLGLAVATCVAACAPFLALVIPVVLGRGGTRSLMDSGNAFFMRMSNRVHPLDALLPIGEVNFIQHCIPLAATAGLLLAASHRPARHWVGAAVAALVLSMGPALLLSPMEPGSPNLPARIPLPLSLLDLLPGFDRFWWPYRALGVLVVGTAGALACWIGSQVPKRRALACVALSLPMVLQGRALTLAAVQHTDPNLPVSLLDPAPQNFWYGRNLPDWVRQDHPSGGVLTFPFQATQNYAHRFTPYHQLPTAMGDGVGERLIRPESFNARVDANQILSAWASGREIQSTGDSDLNQLRQLGFRWVLWFLPSGDIHPEEADQWQSQARRLEPLLGPPDHQEDSLLVWDLTER